MYNGNDESHTFVDDQIGSKLQVCTYQSTITFRLNWYRHATWYGLSVSNTDFGLFSDDTVVSQRDTDLEQITEKQFMNICVAKHNNFIVDTTSSFR